MEYTLTEDTKGCLHCGQFFEAKRASMVFCSDKCKTDYYNLKPAERFLNPPIINRQPLVHGDLYTSHGVVMPLEGGVMRVRLRFEDPEVIKAQKAKKDESASAPVKTVQHRDNGQQKPAKRRGQ